jgi:hypothetical protein
MNAKILFSAIIGGVIITLLTGLISNMKAMLVGATHYGYPFAWLIRLVIAPQYFPCRFNVLFFIADIIIWALIVGIILFILSRRTRS